MAEAIEQESQDMMISNEDLISNMPPPIIHHILNLIPNNKDRTRTCVLSKTWNDFFLTRPNLVFNEHDFNPDANSCISSPQTRDMFVEYVHNSLNHCMENNNHHVESMKVTLSLSHQDAKPLSRDVNMWLKKAHLLNIRKMSLSLGFGYKFKNLILDSDKLVQLHLACLNFVKECRVIRLPNVKVLSFFNVDVRRGAMKKLIFGCPGVQFLHLNHCKISYNIQLLGLLDLIEVIVCYPSNSVKTLKVVSPVFKSFLHLDNGKKSGGYNPNIDLFGCERVIKLHLSTWPSGGVFGEFNCLVELSLVHLVIKGVVSSKSVRKLVMRFCKMGVDLGNVAKIDCPNLMSLEYENNEMPICFVNECNPRNLRYEFSLPREGRAMTIDALQKVFATTFITIENLKVVILLGHIQVVWQKLLSLKRNQIGRYAFVRYFKEDHNKENIPVELQQDQIAPYQVNRFILNFGCR